MNTTKTKATTYLYNKITGDFEKYSVKLYDDYSEALELKRYYEKIPHKGYVTLEIED